MQDEVGAEILDGLTAYSHVHFPDHELAQMQEATTGSVILHGEGTPRFRVEVTEQFLDGDDGARNAVNARHEWNLARAIRQAEGRLLCRDDHRAADRRA